MTESLDKIVPKITNKEDLENKYGILLRHVEQIKSYNKRLNWIIMLRPINKEVASKLKSGGRGKIISIKGKSSEFKFLAGDIPFEAGLSKLGKDANGSDWNRIAHFNSINKQSVNLNEDNGFREKIDKINDLKRKINKIKEQINIIKKKIHDIKEQIKIDESQVKQMKELQSSKEVEILLEEAKNKIKKSENELQQKQQELNEKQQELKNKTSEYNLNFNLSKIQKIVEMDGKKYESFYETDENGHPKYEVYKEKQQPIVYVREVGKVDEYSKIKYDSSKIGYSIDNSQQKDSNDKNIKPIEIFSYEQYERCASNGSKRIRVSNTTKEEFKVEKYYKKDDEFFVKLDGEEGYHKLINGNVLAGQHKKDEYEVYTYDIDSALTKINVEELEELEESYELINPPLTADYDQLSAAQVYKDKEQVNGLTDLESVVKYLKEEQEKLISFPANKNLEKYKAAAKKLSESKEPYDNNIKYIKLLSEISDVIKKEYDKKPPQTLDYNIIAQECDILQLKLGLLGVCGKSVTKNTMELGNILDYGISHGLEILHYPPEPIKLKHVDNEPDEEFLVIDGDGNPRVARNLEGVLFFINNQRNNGVCCLEPNPLWPIKINFDKTPHEIKIDESRESPLLTDGFYTGVIELQKKLGTEPFADKFIYTERLMLNSDFVPRIKLPDGVDTENVRKAIEIDNITEAYQKYGEVLRELEELQKEAGIKYDKNFMEFCQQQSLSSSLETNDVVLGIFNKNEEVKKYFTNPENISVLENFVDNPDSIKKSDKINSNIKDDIEKLLKDNDIKKLLSLKPNNDSLKAKFFGILPNINLLKVFEIKENANKKRKNFLENLDDYVKLVQDRQLQIKERFEGISESLKEEIDKNKRPRFDLRTNHPKKKEDFDLNKIRNGNKARVSSLILERQLEWLNEKLQLAENTLKDSEITVFQNQHDRKDERSILEKHTKNIVRSSLRGKGVNLYIK